MKYKGIIFDLDGVICSTDEQHYLAWKALADKLGVPFDRERNNLLRGVSRMACVDIILEKSTKTYSDEEKLQMAAEKNEMYRRLLAEISEKDLSDDVRNTLNTFRAAGLKLAIGSSSKNTPFILERIGLGNFFDAVSDGNNITHSKPHPEVFLKAAAMLGLAPADCLVVEDAHAGVEAAVAGVFDCAAFGLYYTGVGPDTKLDDPDFFENIAETDFSDYQAAAPEEPDIEPAAESEEAETPEPEKRPETGSSFSRTYLPVLITVLVVVCAAGGIKMKGKNRRKKGKH